MVSSLLLIQYSLPGRLHSITSIIRCRQPMPLCISPGCSSALQTLIPGAYRYMQCSMGEMEALTSSLQFLATDYSLDSLSGTECLILGSTTGCFFSPSPHATHKQTKPNGAWSGHFFSSPQTPLDMPPILCTSTAWTKSLFSVLSELLNPPLRWFSRILSHSRVLVYVHLCLFLALRSLQWAGWA